MSVELESAKRLTALKNKIDTVTETPSNTLSESVDNVIAGYGQGGSGGVNPLEYAQNVNYKEMAFPTGYELTVNMPNSTYSTFINMAFATGIKKVTIIGNEAGDIKHFNTAFQRIPVEEFDFSNFQLVVGDGRNMFNGCNKLHTIKGEFDFTNLTDTRVFLSCDALKEVRFKPNTLFISMSGLSSSSLLSDESIQSIINGLADLTGQTAQTITLHSTVTAKIIANPEWDNAIISKNWTYE